MDAFDQVLNWKLKQGSHPFPGPDGGTCANEAALIAAGYPYKAVRSAADMPDAFSRPICQLVLRLNDHADDADRQRLLPYITRLACADAPAVEAARSAYIDRHVRRDYIDVPFDRALAVLDGALAIGRQADPLGFDNAGGRLEAARGRAPDRMAAESALLRRIKRWFGAKETEPAA